MMICVKALSCEISVIKKLNRQRRQSTLQPLKQTLRAGEVLEVVFAS